MMRLDVLSKRIAGLPCWLDNVRGKVRSRPARKLFFGM